MNRRNSNSVIPNHRISISMPALSLCISEGIDNGPGGSWPAVGSVQWWRLLRKWGALASFLLAVVLFVMHVTREQGDSEPVTHGSMMYTTAPSAIVEMSRNVVPQEIHPRCTKEWDDAYPLTGFTDDGLKTEFQFVTVSDLDEASKVHVAGEEPAWVSYVLKGTLTYNKADKQYKMSHEKTHQNVYGYHAFRGRGMELSELATYNGDILAVDDKSGIIYRLDDPQSDAPAVVPHALLHSGDVKELSTARGFKGEWLTVKDTNLYAGSVGKPFTRNGVVEHTDNLWVNILDCNGAITGENWSYFYDRILRESGYGGGYMVHEAVQWNPTLQKWMFMPRRASHLPYDSATEEFMGTNLLILADEDFMNIQTVKVGEVVPELGCSSIKTIPNTGDRHLVVVKTREIGCASPQDNKTCVTESYLSVVDTDGNVLMPLTKLAGYKIEGFEFI